MTDPKVSNTLRRFTRMLFSSEAEQQQFINSLLNPVERPGRLDAVASEAESFCVEPDGEPAAGIRRHCFIQPASWKP